MTAPVLSGAGPAMASFILFLMPILYIDFINWKANVITSRDRLKNKEDMEFSYPKRATMEIIHC